jgi:hypothetical protein
LIAISAVLLPLSQKAEAHWRHYGYSYHPAYWHHRCWYHGYWYAGFWHPGFWGYYGSPTIIIED